MKRAKHYAKQKRQLSFLSKQLARLFQSGRFYELSRSKRHRLLAKFKKLTGKLKFVLPKWQLQKITGAAIFLTTTLGQVQAQNFAPPVQDTFGLLTELGVNIPNLVDLDGDGDFDILGVNYLNGSSFRFIENVGTKVLPDFSDGDSFNPFGLATTGNVDEVWDFDLADMDNDGDFDIIMGVNTDETNEIGSMFYYENTGDAQNPAFAAPVMNPFGLGNTNYYAFVDLVDLDDDGDTDVVTTEYYGGLKFFENTGTPEVPSFAAPVTDAFNLSANFLSEQNFTFLNFADFDGDGDFDALYNGYGYDINPGGYEGVLYYQENIGTPQAPDFGTPNTETPLDYLPDEAFLAFTDAADLDDDGDLDVLFSRYSDVDTLESVTTWLYFENTSSIVDNVNDLSNSVDIEIFPNPTVEQVNLRALFEEKVDHLTIQLFDVAGRQMAQKSVQYFYGELNESFGMAEYPAGLYLVKIQADGRYSTLSFVKQ